MTSENDSKDGITEDEYNDIFDNNYGTASREFLVGFEKEYPLEEYDVQREDIGGLEKVIDKLNAFKNGVQHPELYSLMGISPPNGFLLHGPPGTGKTLLAKYMAQDLRARFVDLPLNRYESKWVGQSEKMLATHISNMRSYYQNFDEKILLFFDEAEEAFKDRSAPGWHAPRVNVLLREMDGLGDNEGIIFGGATNHLEKIDDALLRAGRFDFILEMPEYDEEDLANIYLAIQNKYNRRAPHHNPFHLDKKGALELGKITRRNGFGPSDINEIFRLSAESKIRDMIDNENDKVSFDMYNIVSDDMFRVIDTYSRYKKKQSRKIGFIQ